MYLKFSSEVLVSQCSYYLCWFCSSFMLFLYMGLGNGRLFLLLCKKVHSFRIRASRMFSIDVLTLEFDVISTNGYSISFLIRFLFEYFPKWLHRFLINFVYVLNHYITGYVL